MKTVKADEPVSRSRFVDCPNCKSRSLKLKKIVQSGRCRTCHESYKIITVFVKTGKKRERGSIASTLAKESQAELNVPSWQTPSDTSLFGTFSETSESTFSNTSFSWESSNKENEPGSGSEQ